MALSYVAYISPLLSLRETQNEWHGLHVSSCLHMGGYRRKILNEVSLLLQLTRIIETVPNQLWDTCGIIGHQCIHLHLKYTQ